MQRLLCLVLEYLSPKPCLNREPQDIMRSCVSRDASPHSVLSRQRGKHGELFSPCPPHWISAPLQLHPLIAHPAVAFQAGCNLGFLTIAGSRAIQSH